MRNGPTPKQYTDGAATCPGHIKACARSYSNPRCPLKQPLKALFYILLHANTRFSAANAAARRCAATRRHREPPAPLLLLMQRITTNRAGARVHTGAPVPVACRVSALPEASRRGRRRPRAAVQGGFGLDVSVGAFAEQGNFFKKCAVCRREADLPALHYDGGRLHRLVELIAYEGLSVTP